MSSGKPTKQELSGELQDLLERRNSRNCEVCDWEDQQSEEVRALLKRCREDEGVSFTKLHETCKRWGMKMGKTTFTRHCRRCHGA